MQQDSTPYMGVGCGIDSPCTETISSNDPPCEMFRVSTFEKDKAKIECPIYDREPHQPIYNSKLPAFDEDSSEKQAQGDFQAGCTKNEEDQDG